MHRIVTTFTVPERENRDWEVSVGTTYRSSLRLTAALSLLHAERSSSDPGQEYMDNRVMFTLQYGSIPLTRRRRRLQLPGRLRMYLEHFGLKEFPFRLTPDSDFLFMSSAHARAKAYMDYTVWNREGFVVITGEIGCGKTTLLQKLLSELNDENVLVAKIFQTQLNEVEFVQAVVVEFGINPFAASKVELMDMLNTFLIDNFRKLKQLVLIVDDAHNGSPMNAFEENETSRTWAQIGQSLPPPKAILCISAHWETSGVQATTMEAPRTLYDFYGFPPERMQCVTRRRARRSWRAWCSKLCKAHPCNPT